MASAWRGSSSATLGSHTASRYAERGLEARRVRGPRETGVEGVCVCVLWGAKGVCGGGQRGTRA